MELKLHDVPTFICHQYIDDINGYKLYYNPLGYGGITVVGIESQNLVKLCDGSHTVEQILQLENRPITQVLEELNILAEKEIVNISNDFTQELHKNSRSKGSISCWMHLTNSCNLACSYCYIHKSPGEMTLEIGKLAIDKMLQSCASHNIREMNIKFAGGEPLLRFGLLKQLVDYSQKTKGEISVTYTVLTNGILITKQIANYLKQNHIGIGVSLDGVGAINDSCRHYKNGEGSFSRVIEGIGILREVGIKPSIMTTVSYSNYRNLLDLTKFLLEGEYRFRFSLERDCISGLPELLNHTNELIESLNECYDYIEQNLPKENFTKLHTFGDVGFNKPSKKSCGAGSNFFSIGHDGKLGVCGLGLAEPFSKLEAENDLLNCVRTINPELATNVASSYPKCNSCVWRKSCAGGCPLQTKATFGKYDHYSPYCEVYWKILPRVLRIKGLQMIRNFEQDSSN